jgi:hypothetical protein
MSYDEGVVADHADLFDFPEASKGSAQIFLSGKLGKASYVNLWITHD